MQEGEYLLIAAFFPFSNVSIQWNCSSFYYGLQLIKDVIKRCAGCLKDLSLVFLMHAQTHTHALSLYFGLSLSLSFEDMHACANAPQRGRGCYLDPPNL